MKNWTVGRKETPEGTIVVVHKRRTNKVLGKVLGPAQEEEVGRVAHDRESSANRNLTYHGQMEIVLARAHQVAAVKNNWHK